MERWREGGREGGRETERETERERERDRERERERERETERETERERERERETEREREREREGERGEGEKERERKQSTFFEADATVGVDDGRGLDISRDNCPSNDSRYSLSCNIIEKSSFQSIGARHIEGGRHIERYTDMKQAI